MTKKSVFSQLSATKHTLKRLGVKRLGLFGSYVRNEENSDSDIDFLVEFLEGKKNYDNFIHLSFFLEDLLHKKVDLLTDSSLSPYLKSSVMAEIEFIEI